MFGGTGIIFILFVFLSQSLRLRLVYRVIKIIEVKVHFNI